MGLKFGKGLDTPKILSVVILFCTILYRALPFFQYINRPGFALNSGVIQACWKIFAETFKEMAAVAFKVCSVPYGELTKSGCTRECSSWFLCHSLFTECSQAFDNGSHLVLVVLLYFDCKI